MHDEKAGRTSLRTLSPLSRLGMLSILDERRRLEERRSAMVDDQKQKVEDAEFPLLMICFKNL